MSFQHNAAPPSEGYTLLPDGDYDLQITNVTEKKSRAGDPMVNVEFEVINNTDFNGKKIFTNVTFMQADKPGAGMSTHFLKTIGQPWEGAIEVDAENWVGERVKAKISTREYTNDKGKKVTTNDIKSFDVFGDPNAKKDDLPF